MTALAPDPRREDTQELTVVLMQLAGEPAVQACRKALSAQTDRIVIVRPTASAPEESLPARRLRGLREAASPLVAFLEDTCIPGPGWYAAICDAFKDPKTASVGGPIKIADHLPARFKALGVCEYARFQCGRLTDPGKGLPAASLAGSNFAVRKSAMAGVSSPLDMIDNAMFARLRSHGDMLMVCEAGVTYAAPDHHGAQLSTRFHHGRIYGGGRTSQQPLLPRLGLALRTILVPFVLTFRSFKDAPAWFWRSPATIMWVVLMHAAWSAGEFAGVLTGRVGASLKEWA